jgi:hypothetical protein
MPHTLKLGDVILSRRSVYFPALRATVDIGEEWPLVVLDGPESSLDSSLPDIRVAPISDAVHFASHRDVRCNAEEGPLGVLFMVELWNQRAMLVHNVARRLGELSREAVDGLCLVHNAIVGAIPFSAVSPDRHGPPIDSENDPRIEYQRDRVLRAGFLSDPVDEILELDAQRRVANPYTVTLERPAEQLSFLHHAFVRNVTLRYYASNFDAVIKKTRDILRTGEYELVTQEPGSIHERSGAWRYRAHVRSSIVGFDISGRMDLFWLPPLHMGAETARLEFGEAANEPTAEHLK